MTYPLGIVVSVLMVVGFVGGDAWGQHGGEGGLPDRPNSIFGENRPIDLETSLQRMWLRNGDQGTSATIKGSNQWGTVGVFNFNRERTQGLQRDEFAGGVRFLPASKIPFLKNHPDLLDFKVGGRVQSHSSARALGGYATLRVSPMGSHYLKLRVAHEDSRDEEGLEQKSDFIDIQQKLLTRESFLVQRLHLGRVIDQVDLAGLLSRQEEEGQVEHIAGAGITIYTPFRHYLMAGLTDLDDDGAGLSKMLSFGRFASTHGRPAKLPLYYFGSYKWDDVSEFGIGGISFGDGAADEQGRRGSQLVKPAEIGMMYGLFTNSGGLVDLRDIRRLEELTSRYGTRTQEIGRVTMLFALLDVEIRDETRPQWGTGHQGFGDVELYVVPTRALLGVNDPFISAAYEWTEDVGFNPRQGFSTKKKDQFTVGSGGELIPGLHFTLLAVPKRRGTRLEIDDVRAELYYRTSLK